MLLFILVAFCADCFSVASVSLVTELYRLLDTA